MRAETAATASFVVQVLVYWLAFLLLAREALRAGSVLGAVLAIASGFLPPLLCSTVMVESNVQVGVAFLAAVALAASGKSWIAITTCVVLLWLGFCVRSGTIVTVPPVAFACGRLLWPHWRTRRTLAVALGLAIAFQGVSYVTTKTVLGAPTRDSVLSVSQVFDMAAIHRETGVHHVPTFMVPAGHTAEAVFAHYQPDMVSGMFWRNDGKPVFRLPKNSDEGAQVRAAWLQTIREFPGVWFRRKVRYAGLFLLIGVEWPGAFQPEYAGNELIGLPKREAPWESPLGRYAYKTATSVLWKGWFWLLVATSIVGLAFVRQASRRWAAAAVLVGGVGSMVPHFLFGQAVLCRYFFLPYLLFVVSILLVLPDVIAFRRRDRTVTV